MRASHLFALLLSLTFMGSVEARDTKNLFSIQQALDSSAYEGRLNPDVKMYFGKESHPTATEKFGTFTTNKKTNAFGKSDQIACEWALLSALLTLQDRALAEGGNAVINIHSFYKKNEFTSDTQYECHSGAIMAGVALRGTVVRTK